MSIEWIGIHEEPLTHIKGVLQEWLNLNEYAVKNWGGDVPWRYNERATLGSFAGAVWRRGGFVIEEYSTEKLKDDSSRYFGRSDMWFEFDGREYDIEAKICFHYLNPLKDPNLIIDAAMKDAVDDAKRLKQYDSSRIACGLVMSVPILDISNRTGLELVVEQSQLEEELVRWVSAIKSQDVTSAWFIREDLHWPLFPDGVRPNCMHPGVAVLIKPINI